MSIHSTIYFVLNVNPLELRGGFEFLHCFVQSGEAFMVVFLLIKKDSDLKWPQFS